MTRRIITLLVALVPIVGFVLLGSNVGIPYAALGPGPTVNALGAVDGSEVVDIEGAEVDETAGHLNMTTVEVRTGLTMFDALGYWVSGRYGIVPIEEVIPDGQTGDEVRESNRAEFEQSEYDAARAALRYLGYPTAVEVVALSEDSASKGVLKPDDRITAVDSVPVGTASQVVELLQGRKPGETVAVDFVRPEEGQEPEPRNAQIELRPHPEEAERGILGVTLTDEPQTDVKVTFNLADVGGPSAGLIFALSVVDKLSPGELNGGRFVAGTGTIDSGGTVGPIGGIRYKLVAAREAGATEFLVPAANCGEARRNAPDGLTLLKVETLDGAISTLEAISSGREAPTC